MRIFLVLQVSLVIFLDLLVVFALFILRFLLVFMPVLDYMFFDGHGVFDGLCWGILMCFDGFEVYENFDGGDGCRCLRCVFWFVVVVFRSLGMFCRFSWF